MFTRGRLEAAEANRIPKPAHPANAPRPFFVKDGCCIACGVWEEVAPDLLAWQEEDGQYGTEAHCYVKRQPETDAEFDWIKSAMDVVDVDCIRIRGVQG